MQYDTKNVCRFCLKLMHSANVDISNDVMREMLSLLLIKLDLYVSDHPVVCGMCSEVFYEIYVFKSKCLYTEDIISTQIKTYLKVSLRDILIELENKCFNVNIAADEVVCRLCIKIPPNGRYIALGESGEEISFLRDTIQIHLPEMDLSITEKPIICEACCVQLKKYVSFAANCLTVEETIKLYCDLENISGQVDLACVSQFIEDKALEGLQTKLSNDLVIKQEEGPVIVKVEKVQGAEDYLSEGHSVDWCSNSEFYLKTEEIEITSENYEIRWGLIFWIVNFYVIRNG